jgi:hypothetical protein
LQREGVPQYPEMTNFLFDPEGKQYEGRLQAQLKAAADQKRKIDQSRAEIAQSRDLLSNEVGEWSQSMAGVTAYGQRIERQQAAEGSQTRTSDSAKKLEEDLSWLPAALNEALNGGPTRSHQSAMGRAA